MRFEKYLVEGSQTPDDIIKMLHTDCAEWFNQIKGDQVCYRGAKPITGVIEKRIPRKVRKPRDTPMVLHNSLDDEFKKKFGWKARSEGVFATSNMRQARGYGAPHAFFPIGKFKYIYSDQIEDLSDYFENEEVLAWVGDDDGYEFYEGGVEFGSERFNNILKRAINTYSDKRLSYALESDVEIMFYCPKGYYLVENYFVQDNREEIYK